MKRTSIICLALILMSCCECLGGTDPSVVSSSDVQSSGQPAQKATSVESKISMADIFCPTTNEEARKFYNDALEFERQGKDDEAAAGYLKAIEKDPQYCDAMDNIGQLFRRKGDIDQAISWYKRSLVVKPDNVVAHQDLAVAYRVQGDTVKTLSEYQWLVTNNPNNPEGYYGLGMTYLDLRQTSAAIKALERAAELYQAGSSPYLGDALYLLGLCYLDPSMRDSGKARNYLMKARQLGATVPPELIREMDM